MRSHLVIVFQVRQQHMSEVPLSEHNNVVKAFPSDRTDQPFGTSILPRGAWRCRPVANAHRSKSSDEDFAIGPIPVTDQIAGSLFPTACFRDLICDPFCSRMSCDAKPQNLPSAVLHDQQSIEQPKRDRRHDEHIHRSDPISVMSRNIFQPCDGGSRLLTIYLATLVCPTSIPSLSNSPWIRGAPHSGLAMLISRISLRTFGGTVGRPPPRLDFQRQYDLNPARCHFMTVSGFTIARAFRIVGANRYSPAKIKRSAVLKVCLFGECRLSTKRPSAEPWNTRFPAVVRV